ncbi:class II aaRS and biotin synthetase [Gymnopus androsaceus JB14]|uniref:serine--tRNA ligase n=1 Tax=Gymnopus androsaceus JB14 TaxID=1447944 RepID=A0A6A4HTC6_9AGAR|nr:class II aaRS and biotin synthetase [Gymnopus androsaceus JB14]
MTFFLTRARLPAFLRCCKIPFPRRHSSSDSTSYLPPPRLNYRSISENFVYKSTNALNRKAPLPSDAIKHVSRLYTEFKNLSTVLNAKRNARSMIGETIRRSASENDLQAKEAALKEAKGLKEEITEMEISCSRTSWYFLINEGALLELALTNYAMSVAIKYGFKPVTTPDIVRSDIARRCGFQPRDHEQQLMQSYHLQSSSPSSPELILAGTAEIPLAGMFANQIFPSTALPQKIVGIGHAFRAEAGARGADTRGLYRVHQFSKLELFAVTTAEESEAMMEEMRQVQESILNGLDLPIRILDMPTEELGASAYRKYDIEAWMPGRGAWGEVSSLSNCTDFQARRLHIRYHVELNKQNLFAHTLNGTAAAIPRLIVALIENGVEFNDAGEPVAIALPAVLKPYWLGVGSQNTVIKWKS